MYIHSKWCSIHRPQSLKNIDIFYYMPTNLIAEKFIWIYLRWFIPFDFYCILLCHVLLLKIKADGKWSVYQNDHICINTHAHHVTVHTSERQVWAFVDGVSLRRWWEHTKQHPDSVGSEGKACIWIFSSRESRQGAFWERTTWLYRIKRRHMLKIPLAEGARKSRTGIAREKVLRESDWTDRSYSSPETHQQRLEGVVTSTSEWIAI